MKWGLRSSRHNQREKQQRTQEEEHKHEQQEDKGNKSRAAFLSFSPLAWLSKLTAKNNAAAAKPKPAAPADKSAVAATGGFPSCFFKGASSSTSTSVSLSSSAASQSSLADSSPADHQAPRRLSVGNDGDTAEAAAARQLYHRRRHYSVGGDRDLQTLRNLIPFSRAASPIPVPAPFVPALKTTPPLLPSDTDEEKRPRNPAGPAPQRRRRAAVVLREDPGRAGGCHRARAVPASRGVGGGGGGVGAGAVRGGAPDERPAAGVPRVDGGDDREQAHRPAGRAGDAPGVLPLAQRRRAPRLHRQGVPAAREMHGATLASFISTRLQHNNLAVYLAKDSKFPSFQNSNGSRVQDCMVV
ncbi:hypothetical protein OsJ_03458 [Oryza sativa Japonica Group]|uniref:Uncharacterized protein n=1 Tax=Oryza sativa subsp. japonica TaxID=39947 RepID=B9EZN9_ORYSJ|nr:hypothetical protein OsJ_03458 [Oryza sativa Japonica Group]